MRLRLSLDDSAGRTATGETSMDFADRDSLSIGRAEGSDWQLPDASRLMSGKHCEIRRAGEDYFLHDLSTNGTFLHGSKTRIETPHRLRNGDRLVMGGYLIRVELEDDRQPTESDDPTRLVARPDSEPELQLTVDKLPDGAADCPPPARLDRHGALRIGRDEKADWVLPDPSGGISRTHGTVTFEDGAFRLRDHSSNGTFVNGSSERIAGSYRLRNGDHLRMGSYRIAVHTRGVADEAGAAVAASKASDCLGVRTPAPGHASTPMRRGGDPAEMLDDVPALSGATPGDAAFADGMTRVARAADKPPMPSPDLPKAPAVDVNEAVVSPPEAETSTVDPVLAAMARSLGLPPGDLGETDAARLGERLGELIALLTEEIRQILALRDSALGRTTGLLSAAGASNPLSWMPTTEEALRVLFGPPRRAYLDSRQSFAQTLLELRQHFQQTNAAIRAAVSVLADDWAPEAIEKAAAADNRLGPLLGSRKARLWDIYVERYTSRVPLQRARAIASFLEAFAPPAPNDAAAHPAEGPERP